jgi:carbamoyltransferase-like protein
MLLCGDLPEKRDECRRWAPEWRQPVTENVTFVHLYILGFSAYYHDSAACLVQDGEIVAAAQEERFTRKKHDPWFLRRAIQYCLTQAGIEKKILNMWYFTTNRSSSLSERCPC